MADDLPQIDNPISVFPKPQRMFPEDARPAGGQYLNARTKEDMTGHKAAMASIGVNPGGRPYFNASSDSVEQTGSPGRGSAIAKTNLFKQRAGWSWLRAPEGHEDTNTIVSVEHRGDHHYALNAHFPKGVDLARYAEAKSEPRLRPTTRGNLTKGTQVGIISVRGKEHPVYDHVIVKADGGIVGDPDTDEGITAYHGSPHDFERFDMSKIGTGEGAQAYGHGLYFAQNENVAKGYRDALAGKVDAPQLRVGDKTYPVKGGGWADRKEELLHRLFKEAKSHRIDNQGQPLGQYSDEAIESELRSMRASDELRRWAESELKGAGPIDVANPGHMYEVRINAHPDHFLDWDKPFDEQSHHVKQAILKIYGNTIPEKPINYGNMKPFIDEVKDITGSTALKIVSPENWLHGKGDMDAARNYLASSPDTLARFEDVINRFNKLKTPTGEDLLKWMANPDETGGLTNAKNTQDASEKLNELGVKGVKYLDRSSRATGEGSRNYVVFNDKLVNVKRKYAKGGTVQRTPKPVSDGSIVTRALMLTSKKA